jgi:photosystem II oxygen-evolving enhancer protein 2
MLRRIAVIVLLVLSLSLFPAVTSANAATTAGLKPYIDSLDGYRFLYPNGWTEIAVKNGPDIVLHDLIEPSENVSVIINPVADRKTLADLGTPGEVGYKLMNNAIAPPNSNRQAELVNAESLEKNGKIYYILEYAVKVPQGNRHNIASVAVNRGQLYTFNASATEKRWRKIKDILTQSAKSFTVD